MSDPGSLILNKSGDEYSLAREEQFRALVSQDFQPKTLFYPGPAGMVDGLPSLFQVKTLTSGKTHRFEQVSDPTAAQEFVPGDEMSGTQIEFDKGTITVDRPIWDAKSITDEPDILAHWEFAGPASRNISYAIANEADTRLCQTIISAARTSSLTKNGLTIHSGGNAVSRIGGGSAVSDAYPNSSTGSDRFLDDVAQLQYEFDIDNVPEAGRYLVITPYIRRVLQENDTKIFNSDYSRSPANDFNKRVIGELFGFMVLTPYNRMPTDNGVASGRPAKYQNDNTYAGSNGEPVALAVGGVLDGQAPAGLVVAGGLRTGIEYEPLKMKTTYHASLMMGAGVLNPYCAGIIQAKAS